MIGPLCVRRRNRTSDWPVILLVLTLTRLRFCSLPSFFFFLNCLTYHLNRNYCQANSHSYTSIAISRAENFLMSRRLVSIHFAIIPCLRLYAFGMYTPCARTSPHKGLNFFYFSLRLKAANNAVNLSYFRRRPSQGGIPGSRLIRGTSNPRFSFKLLGYPFFSFLFLFHKIPLKYIAISSQVALSFSSDAIHPVSTGSRDRRQH